MQKTPNLAVLVSGSGTLLEAMIEDGIEISVVAADRECRGLEVANKAGIPAELLKRSFRKDEFNRLEYTKQMVDLLKHYDVDVVAMAGFMTVFEDPIFEAYPQRVLNSHPSLLSDPKVAHIGGHAVRDSLEAGDTYTGTTIHIANREVDHGKILAEKRVEILPNDTEETLHERIKVEERKLYPQVIREFLNSLDKGRTLNAKD